MFTYSLCLFLGAVVWVSRGIVGDFGEVVEMLELGWDGDFGIEVDMVMGH